MFRVISGPYYIYGIHIHVFNDFDHDVETLKTQFWVCFLTITVSDLRNTSNPAESPSQDPPLKIEMNGAVSTAISILISYYRMKIHEHQLFCETMWKLLGLNRSPVVNWRYLASAAAVYNMPFPNPACATKSLIERWTVDGQGEPWLAQLMKEQINWTK